MTEFSLPTPQKTIPICTIRVESADQAYFTAKKEAATGKYGITFQFETDELVHTMNSTVRLSWMEAWLEKYLQEKQMTREILFLATEVLPAHQFESTRIADPRLQALEKKVVVPEKVVVQNTIEEGLVEFDQIMAGWEDPKSENDNILLMKNSVFCLFRSFDREDLGKISKEEFFDVGSADRADPDDRHIVHERGRDESLPALRPEQRRPAEPHGGEPHNRRHPHGPRLLPHRRERARAPRRTPESPRNTTSTSRCSSCTMTRSTPSSRPSSKTARRSTSPPSATTSP